jgi:glycosyltransferase involved in cell wall biosynthesis
MRIVIDMQGAQSSGSRTRGIGRYTLSLTKEMIRQRGDHEVILVLNGLFPETVEPLRASFADFLPQNNIRVWETAGPVASIEPSNEGRRKAAENIREAFIASLKPDVVLDTSIFEGLVDDAVTSIGVFTSRLPTVVILYDLIPLIHRRIYLENPVVERWYLNKLDHLRRADLLLSISASSGKEAVDHLGLPPAKVVNISTACDKQFQALSINDALRAQTHKTYGLLRPFVMYTGGIDHRKNIEGLIRAYASLPPLVRAEHQLAIVCSIQPPERERLQQLAETEGLAPDELVITGFIPEEDLLTLYNTCKLFVFPSWHEGFGLPALEAMACGRAVIGANTSSIPEVIEREDALFDPFDDTAIASKLLHVLTDDAFRTELESHGATQAKKFTWEKSARHTWIKLEEFVNNQKLVAPVTQIPSMLRRPRLAYFAPLPPEKSGISKYSTDLLPELSAHYEIEVIVAQSEVLDAWVLANCTIRDVGWFRQNTRYYDRVIYHFGNSDFHSHMFDLLDETPGVVVMHDFFLSGVIANMHHHGVKRNGWAKALVHSHGWTALQAYNNANSNATASSDLANIYPCNLEVLEQALGVIVHSSQSCQLAMKWFGPDAAKDWTLIPLLRTAGPKMDRELARQKLGLLKDDFIVCSFGALGPTKLNQRLLSAWLASPMTRDPHCVLVFVGQNHNGDYGENLVRTIQDSAASSRIVITGWTDSDSYQHWLEAADVGVQLRTLSRGETSAAVLDCMNCGLATIVNANGSMADLPQHAVLMLPDEFQDDELISGLTELWKDVNRRSALGQCASEFLRAHHQPRVCAQRYAEAIEHYYQPQNSGLPALFDALARVAPPLPVEDVSRVASALANNYPPQARRRQLLLDVSIIAQGDARSGIQRVVRSLLREFLLNPPTGWVVEPVCATGEVQGYRYARRFANQFLGITEDWANDTPVEAYAGDALVGLDLQHGVLPLQKDYLNSLRRRGVAVYFVVYDLLPVLQPSVFPNGTDIRHQEWLSTLTEFDGAFCISRAVADELYDWLQVCGPKRYNAFSLHWFHLGADVENSMPTTGLPPESGGVLKILGERPSFLMVGTIEPRKGQGQALAAFESLWGASIDVNLVIVGKQGWKIEWLIEKFKNHPEFGRRLFWLDGVSDEYLERVYATSSCLIASSEGEGFGLPLIEAAQHKLAIIARDIPVFREVAGDYAHFFPDDKDPEVLASSVHQWLSLYRLGAHPRSHAMPWLNWKASAQQLFSAVTGGIPYKTWMPDGIQRYWGSDPRLHTQVGERIGQAIRTTGLAGMLVYGPYLPFEAGAYQITLKGKAQTSTAGCWFDTACDEGALQLVFLFLTEPGTNGDWTMTTNLVLDHAVKDLEVRLWVPATANLSLASIVIALNPHLESTNQPMLELDEIKVVEETAYANHAAIESTVSNKVAPKNKKSKKNKRR